MYNYKYCIIMYIYLLLLLYILAVKRISEENDY